MCSEQQRGLEAAHSTYGEVAGLEISPLPSGQPARAALWVMVDALVEDEVDPTLPALPFDVLAVLVGVRRREELRAAVDDRDLLLRVFLLDLCRKF